MVYNLSLNGIFTLTELKLLFLSIQTRFDDERVKADTPKPYTHTHRERERAALWPSKQRDGVTGNSEQHYSTPDDYLHKHAVGKRGDDGSGGKAQSICCPSDSRDPSPHMRSF